MDEREERVVTIVLGTRHLVLGLFSAFVLFVALGGLGVVVARAFLPSILARNEPVPQEQVLVVDAATMGQTKAASEPIRIFSDKAVPPRKPTTVPKPPREPATPPHEAPLPVSAPAPSGFIEPQPGQLFLQVVSTSKAQAAASAERLAKTGLPSVFAKGDDERSFRVLIGPIETKEQAPELRARLEQMGFQPFLRRYKGAPKP